MIEGPSDSFLQALSAAISCCFISRWVEVIRGNKRGLRLAGRSDGYRHFSNHAAHNLHIVCEKRVILWQYDQRFNLSCSGRAVGAKQSPLPPQKVQNNYKIKFKRKFIFIHIVSVTIKIVPRHSINPEPNPPTSSSYKEKVPFHRKKPWGGLWWLVG